MTAERDDLDALRRALEAFGQEHARNLVEEARADALERARSILATEMTRALLDRTVPYLGGGFQAPPPPVRRPSPAPSARDATYDTGSATYVYGITSADAGELSNTVANVEGVGSSPPFTIEQEGLVAIASEVPLAEFDEERLRENLNDVEWLEQTARGHELVLEAAREGTTIIPLRLCTIYRGEDHVREMLEREQAVFRDALSRLEGKTEWGVKLIAEPGALEAALAEDEPEDAGEVSPGVAYLKSRGREAKERERIDDLANAWAAEAHDRLANAAVEALLNPLQNPEVSGHVGEMLLNGVYLVEDAGMDAFMAEIEALVNSFDDRGVSVEMTGPWPPYNFVKGSIEAAR
jgi:hypothetical protein